jgi:hypothetical protein
MLYGAFVWARRALNGPKRRLSGPGSGYGVPHGYQQTSLYDGIVAEQDDYHQYFMREMGGKEPETGWPKLDMNSWRGEAALRRGYSVIIPPIFWFVWRIPIGSRNVSDE